MSVFGSNLTPLSNLGLGSITTGQGFTNLGTTTGQGSTYMGTTTVNGNQYDILAGPLVILDGDSNSGGNDGGSFTNVNSNGISINTGGNALPGSHTPDLITSLATNPALIPNIQTTLQSNPTTSPTANDPGTLPGSGAGNGGVTTSGPAVGSANGGGATVVAGGSANANGGNATATGASGNANGGNASASGAVVTTGPGGASSTTVNGGTNVNQGPVPNGNSTPGSSNPSTQTGPAANDPVFNLKNGIRLARILGPIPTILASALIPDNASLNKEWDVNGVHYKYNTDDFSFEISHLDGTKEQVKMYPDGTVTDQQGAILGSVDKNGQFAPVTEQEERDYRIWKANGGDGSFAVWKNSGKPSDTVGTIEAKKTVPTGTIGGKPTGKPTKINSSDDEATIRSHRRENESANLLASAGYKTEQNPDIPGTNKKPDLLIEDKVFDVKAPSTDKARNAASEIQKAVVREQADRIVLNLEDSDITLEQMKHQLDTYPIDGLKEVIVIKDSKVIPFWL